MTNRLKTIMCIGLCLIAVFLVAFRDWKTGGSSVWWLSTEVPLGETYTHAVYIRNQGTCTNGINLEGTYTADINLQSGDTITNTVAGTVSLSGALSITDDLTVDSINAVGSGDTVDFNGGFKYGTITTPVSVNMTTIVSDQVPLQVNVASIANPAAGKNVIGSYSKAAAITADQANTTLYGSFSGVDIDMAVADAYGHLVSITRNGDKDVTNAVYGIKSDIDYESGAAMTCDVYGLHAQITGTTASSGTSIVGYFLGDVNVTEVLEAETSTGKTVTDVLLLDNNGTATNALFIDNDGTLTTGIKIDGTITNGIDLSGAAVTADIKLENSDTINNGTTGTVTFSDNIGIDMAKAIGSGDTADSNAHFKVGEIGTAATYNLTSVAASHWMYQCDAASTADPGGGLNFGAFYFKSAATTADQTNTTLYGGLVTVDTDMAVADARGLTINMTRDGNKDVTNTIKGLDVYIDYEAGNATTCDVRGLEVEITGTNASSGAEDLILATAGVSVETGIRIENESGKTMTAGLHFDNSGTLTADIKLQNDETITNSPDGDITMSGDINAVNSGQLIGPWHVDDVAQGSANTVMDTGGSATYSMTDEIIIVRAGSVVGIACYGNADATAETIDFDVTIDGTKTGLIAQLNTSEVRTDTATQAKDADTFTAGQRIGIKWTSSGGFTPNGSVDYTCTVLIEQ